LRHWDAEGVNRDLDASKWQLVTAAFEFHSGAVRGREAVNNAEAIEVGRQPKPRVVRTWRPHSILWKEECKAVDCGGEEVWALVRLLPI
jgi:hypothetical protein